jgi:Fic family protein
MLAPEVAPPSEEDYLAGDSGFQTQQSALQAALQRYLADSDFQKNTYEQDYGKSLRDLGYDEGNKAWNWNDKLTASGRGNQAQLDDFGNRGMLQSSAYADAFNELQRMLGQQYESMSSGKQTFMTDMDNQVANFKGENTANSQAARAEALQRRAAQYGL